MTDPLEPVGVCRLAIPHTGESHAAEVTGAFCFCYRVFCPHHSNERVASVQRRPSRGSSVYDARLNRAFDRPLTDLRRIREKPIPSMHDAMSHPSSKL